MNREVQAQPQADGDPRNIMDAQELLRGRAFRSSQDGPVRVHAGAVGPAFGPPASHVLMARDAAVTALVEPMARMLYQAFQAQHLGAFDDVEFDDLSTSAKQRLVNDARCALHWQSPLYRSEAERMVKATVMESLETTAMHYPVLNPVADQQEQNRRKGAFAHALRAFSNVDLPTLMFVAYRLALTRPLPYGEQKQVTLTALRGMF